MSLTKGRNNLKLKELTVTNGQTGETAGHGGRIFMCSYTQLRPSFEEWIEHGCRSGAFEDLTTSLTSETVFLCRAASC